MVETKDKQQMSKSQKKRLKRNKAKKRTQEEEEAPKPQQQKTQEALNPHIKLRNDLLSLGYTQNEIDKGMEDMWNLGMKYDELDSVTMFLEDKRHESLVQQDIEEDDVVVVTETNEKDEGGDGGEEVTSEKDEDLLSADTSNNTPAATTSVTEDDAINEDVPASASASPEPTMDLISKLEVVSDFENLQDALFALSEWVNKAAKSHELFGFCGVSDETTTSPFATILKRSISYNVDDDEYYRTVILPYLHSLLSGLLVDHVDTSSVVDQLLNVIYLSRSTMKQLQSVSSLPSSVRDNISIGVSRLIAALVHKNLISNVSSDTADPSTQMNLLTNEMEQLLSQVESSSSTGGGVVELMTERDCRKCLAEKACDLSKLLLQSYLNEKQDGGVITPSTPQQQLLQSNEGKLTMFSSLLGEHCTSVQSSVRSYNDIETRIKNLQADLTLKHAGVAAESLQVHSDLQRITRRKSELKLELEQLERNEVRLQNREIELNKILSSAEEKGTGSSEVVYLQTQRDELVGMVRTDDSLRTLVDKISIFEMVLCKTSDNGDAVQQPQSYTDVSAGDVESKMTLLLNQMQSYFQAEAAIIKFLQDRVQNMKAEHKDLQRETVQFTALGLTTNVNQMNQSLEEISRNITEDESVLAALSLEATKMETSLYERINDYVNAPTGNCVLSSVHRSALSNIIQSLNTRGIITDVSKLSSFLPPSDHSTGMSTSINGSRGVAIAAPKSAPVVAAPPPPQESVSLKPMLNWATVGSKAPIKKKSLLDIQKEEMSAKQAAT